VAFAEVKRGTLGIERIIKRIDLERVRD